MDIKSCPICNNFSEAVFEKSGVEYMKCTNCEMIYCRDLSQEGLIGGEFEVERNEKHNSERLKRIEDIVYGMKKEDVYILDFGCGHGMFIDFLKNNGFPNVDGYDSYNPEYQKLPAKEKYHVITCVETAEHFSSPFTEMNLIYKSLVVGGCVFIETGYLNATRKQGISDDENPYINPLAGHSTIYTHHAMDLLMTIKGFSVKPRFNQHCLLYQKLK